MGRTNISQSIILLIFFLNVILFLPVFFPNLSEINKFDESIYINGGRILIEDTLPIYSSNPMVAILYALIYIPVQTSPYWLIHSCTIGRFILFALLWLGSYLIAKEMSPLSHPLFMISLLFVSPILINLLGNPSDALFAAMSAFAFWQILSFYHSKRLSHLWKSSVFVALAALSRNDGLVLFAILILISFLINLFVKFESKITFRRINISLIACTTPFVIIISSYILIYGLITGNFEFGTTKRSYVAFEQGQGVAYSHLYSTRNPYVEGQVEARRLFGTPEENRYSVINAISRNPKAFLERVVQIAKKAPYQCLSIYGGAGTGLLLFLLVGRGMIKMARCKLYLLLCISLLWSLHLIIYFAFFFRGSYFLLPYFVVLSLASIGLASMVRNFESRKERYLWSTTLFGLAALGIGFNEARLFVSSLIFLLGLWSIWIIISQYENHKAIIPIGLVLTVFVVSLTAKGYPSPKFRTLGIAPDEKAALFMKEHLEPGARVGAYAPGNVWLPKMTYVPMYLNLRYINSNEDLLAWMLNQKVEAIYVDEALKNFEPSLWMLIFAAESLSRKSGKALARRRPYGRAEGASRSLPVLWRASILPGDAWMF